MKLLLLLCLLLYNSIHTAQSVIVSQSGTQEGDVYLVCVNEGKAVWEQGADRGRSTILRAENGEIQKYRPDPENRYSVTEDLSLLIRNINLSDSGVYYCNATPVVNLTVNPAPTPTAADQRPSTTSTGGSSSSPVSSSGPTSKAQGVTESQTTSSITFSSTTITCTSTTSSSVSSSETGSTDEPQTTSPHISSKTSTAAQSSSESEEDPSENSAEETQSTHITQKITNDSSENSAEETQSRQKKTKDSSENSAEETESMQKITNHVLIGLGVLVGVLLTALALSLLRCYFKRKGAKVRKTDHIYETIDDSAPTTQPASAAPKEYEAIYVLAGDPDIIKLGLKNQSAASPLISQAQSTENNQSEPLYSTIQTDDM